MHRREFITILAGHPILSVLAPERIATEAFTDATAAVTRLKEIYERNTRFLRDRFEAFARGETPMRRVRATYPFVRITTSTHARLDSRLSYGFVAGPGVHETTVTRPDLFHAYLTEQIGLLIGNHGMPVEIGESSEPIPIHFAYRRDINIEAALFSSGNSVVDRPLRDVFDTPDLAAMDDAIANGTLQLPLGASEPLALFRAARVDYSLHRLYHYTGTDPEHFCQDDEVRQFFRRDGSLDGFLMGRVSAVDRVDPQRLIHADPLVGSPRLAVPPGSSDHSLDAHQRGERSRTEIRAGRSRNPRDGEGAIGHHPLHEFLAVKTELVGIVIRIGGERGGDRASRLYTPKQIVVDQRAMGDLGARVQPRKQPLCPLECREHHIDGDIPVGVAVDLDAGPVHPLDPGVEVVLRRCEVAVVWRLDAGIGHAERHRALRERPVAGVLRGGADGATLKQVGAPCIRSCAPC